MLTLPLYAYPGYTLTVNVEEKDYEAESYGRMILHTDVPEADVVVACTGSPFLKIGIWNLQRDRFGSRAIWDP